MRPSRLLCALTGLFLCYLLFATAAWAQQDTADYQGILGVDPHSQGEPEFTPSQWSRIYTIDPGTGNLIIHIPIFTLPRSGRGPAIHYSILYNAAATTRLTAGFTQTQYHNYATYSWLV